MSIKRGDFVLLLGVSAGAVALASLGGCDKKNTLQQLSTSVKSSFLFPAIKNFIFLETAGFKPEKQKEEYGSYEVVDDLVLPAGFGYELNC